MRCECEILVRSCSAVALAVGLAVASGCGSGLVQVEGTVTRGGAPMANAWVEFYPKSGARPGSAFTDENGHYELVYPKSIGGTEPGGFTVKIGTGGENVTDGQTAARRVELFSTDVDVTPDRSAYDFEVPAAAPPKRK